MGILSRIFISLFIVVAMPYYWLLIDARTADVPARTIDIAAIRRAAVSIEGPKPTAISYAVLAVRDMPGTALVAGGGLRADRVAKIAFRLATPGGDTLIDTGLTQYQAEDMDFDRFNPAARREVDAWMHGAQRILVTHEHPDYVGGFLASRDFDTIAPRVILNRAQAETMDRMRRGVIDSVGRIVDGPAIAAVAPGIVLVRTPGHTPGSQMIYVQLANGREYLFTGDVAAMERNVTWLRPRSRLASGWQGGEDRVAVIGWLKGLAALKAQQPRLTLVYANDLNWMQNPRRGPHFATSYIYTAQDPDPSLGGTSMEENDAAIK
ncbi:MBL fold metallo-hydrolase [Novosphingobium sp. KCTC 2891]|uniref:MBL fold metallo-hydrolase n=1 Tax=Novosphingobium sp. KCTC 2891 TaxID=2989730 RepID=UPI0022228CE6|nr:MBL fold metallo-hydrolase [Novosphingobium sp. KCTC 2891]MCW1384213.1 MBL fold metallo-hydrolase [Novosphingobium sp. KCTC 2891]